MSHPVSCLFLSTLCSSSSAFLERRGDADRFDLSSTLCCWTAESLSMAGDPPRDVTGDLVSGVRVVDNLFSSTFSKVAIVV